MVVAPRHNGRSGAALIESCLALGLICLIFLGLFQVSQLLAARDVAMHAAGRMARARTVGFNRWMVRKVARVAAIPVSGRMLEPGFVNDAPALLAALETQRAGDVWSGVVGGNIPMQSRQSSLEIARIPEYLGAENWARAEWILDYEGWRGLHAVDDGNGQTELLTAQVSQAIPLWVPLARTFYRGSNVVVRGEAFIENHYPLYLEDQGW